MVSTFLLFVIPMSIITILYILIGLQLRKSKIVQRGAINGSSVRLKVNILYFMFRAIMSRCGDKARATVEAWKCSHCLKCFSLFFKINRHRLRTWQWRKEIIRIFAFSISPLILTSSHETPNRIIFNVVTKTLSNRIDFFCIFFSRKSFLV